MDGQASRWTRTPSTTPLQPKKWNAHFWIKFKFWWSVTLVICHPSPAKKNEMLIFGLCLMSNDQLGWSIDSNPIDHPSPAKKMKCSFFHYIQHLMIGQAGQWTQIPSATPLQPKKWNAHFSITFKFWWSAGLVDGLEHHLPPLSSQKMKCSFLDYIQLLMIGWADQWMARLVDGLKPYPPPLSSQQNEMLIFGLCSTSDDQAGWLMDSNPICHLFPATKLKCLFLDYVQILMIGWGNWWTWTPSATPLQPKNEMLIFGLH